MGIGIWLDRELHEMIWWGTADKRKTVLQLSQRNWKILALNYVYSPLFSKLSSQYNSFKQHNSKLCNLPSLSLFLTKQLILMLILHLFQLKIEELETCSLLSVNCRSTWNWCVLNSRCIWLCHVSTFNKSSSSWYFCFSVISTVRKWSDTVQDLHSR